MILLLIWMTVLALHCRKFICLLACLLVISMLLLLVVLTVFVIMLLFVTVCGCSWLRQGEVDAIFHSGDISYANGYLSNWDFFMDLISPMAGGAVYLTTVGNHESDWPGTATIYDRFGSNGECGVMSTTMLPMPQPATVDEPWWSYDIGENSICLFLDLLC